MPGRVNLASSAEAAGALEYWVRPVRFGEPLERMATRPQVKTFLVSLGVKF
jgi:hypothetical protein